LGAAWAVPTSGSVWDVPNSSKDLAIIIIIIMMILKKGFTVRPLLTPQPTSSKFPLRRFSASENVIEIGKG
jgi:hypothetical protein